jgi:putative FmdB family regulatory protein
VPLYDFRCPTCDERFELRRSMAEADEPASCPSGHAGAKRLLAVFASTGRSGGTSSSTAPASMPSGGGGCGGHCACH